MHINQYLIHKKLPKIFRTKVRTYLDYLLVKLFDFYFLQTYKKNFKLDDDEVYNMLNENLRMQLIVHLNAKMLH
jgi:hypothetical protein